MMTKNPRDLTTPTTSDPVGFGSSLAPLRFYIANRPPIDHYPQLDRLQMLVPGEIAHIVANTSNHWRKAFNVCAKLLYAWHTRLAHPELPASWQAYRDQELFRNTRGGALLFSPPDLAAPSCWHIVFGKTWASQLSLPALHWHDAFFATASNCRVIVSPYPDYRQLTNERIDRLIELLVAHSAH